MAMLGKRFQRTISMSQIGPGSNLHAEKAKAKHKEGEQPVNQWEILKNAEAMMMMMIANSGASEEGPLLQEKQSNIMAASSKQNEQHSSSLSTEHMIGSPSSLIIPTHHFLDACFFCKRRLRPERDIFIYRGDAAFCTEECRYRQILSDETHSRGDSKKGGGAASETAVAA